MFEKVYSVTDSGRKWLDEKHIQEYWDEHLPNPNKPIDTVADFARATNLYLTQRAFLLSIQEVAALRIEVEELQGQIQGMSDMLATRLKPLQKRKKKEKT